MNKQFPELHDFFGAYFHQDWPAEYQTAEQALDAFLAESDLEILETVLQELGVLLKQRKTECEMKEYLLRELSCYYSYWTAWETSEAWLHDIACRIARKINPIG